MKITSSAFKEINVFFKRKKIGIFISCAFYHNYIFNYKMKKQALLVTKIIEVINVTKSIC